MSNRNNFPAPKICLVSTTTVSVLPDAGRSEQQKTSARTAGLGEAEFTPLHGGDDARQHLGLAANFAGQLGGQFVEFADFLVFQIVCIHALPAYHGTVLSFCAAATT